MYHILQFMLVSRCSYTRNRIVRNNASNILHQGAEITVRLPVTTLDILYLNITNNYSNYSGTFYIDCWWFLLFLENLKSATLSYIILANNTGAFQSGILQSSYNADTRVEVYSLYSAFNDFRSPVVYDSRTPSTVVLFGNGYVHVADSRFFCNSVTALEIIQCVVVFAGNNTFIGNTGYNGGGITAHGQHSLVFNNTSMRFENNSAKNNGGGIYVSGTHQFCSFGGEYAAKLEFQNNHAGVAGNDLYGDPCYSQDLILESSTGAIDLASDPLRVCSCYTCNVSTVQVYPGSLLYLSLIVLGYVAEVPGIHVSGVPSTVHAQLLPLHPEPGSIPSQMMAQESERDCSRFEYRVISTNRFEVLSLTVVQIPVNLIMWYYDDHESHGPAINEQFQVVPYFIEIELLPCPVGFQLSDGECYCTASLLDFVIKCSIDTQLLQINPSAWISAINTSHQKHNASSHLYLMHKHCPFDFCNSRDSFEFSLEEPDAQCHHNRSGILCGECKPGHSLILGSMECRQCTNIYLLLLIPLRLAGILLILFLSLTDMTVAAGTTNGLLFYANIVWENKATSFPPEEEGGFLSVFIAWLNLDLGIMTCRVMTEYPLV